MCIESGHLRVSILDSYLHFTITARTEYCYRESSELSIAGEQIIPGRALVRLP